jgi:hypothetical protein
MWRGKQTIGVGHVSILLDRSRQTYKYIYIYIYIERVRDGDRDKLGERDMYRQRNKQFGLDTFRFY